MLVNSAERGWWSWLPFKPPSDADDSAAPDLAAEDLQALERIVSGRFHTEVLSPALAESLRVHLGHRTLPDRLYAVLGLMTMTAVAPLWIYAAIPHPLQDPVVVYGLLFGLLLGYAALTRFLLVDCSHRLIDWAIGGMFMATVVCAEYVRYSEGFSRGELTPSIILVVPVMMLSLVNQPPTRSIGFVICYGLVILLFDALYLASDSTPTPSIWLMQALVLGPMLVSNLLRQVSIQHEWAARLLLRSQAFRDPLTGLPNRRALEDHFERVQRQQHRSDEGSHHYLALIDLDRFKQINDTYGHVRGDQVLGHVALILNRCARRPFDMVARIGGDEFAIFLYDCASIDGEARVEALLRDIRLARLEHEQSPDHIVTCSAGGCSISPGRTLTDSMRVADTSLYRAKSNGRNQLFTGSMERGQRLGLDGGRSSRTYYDEGGGRASGFTIIVNDAGANHRRAKDEPR